MTTRILEVLGRSAGGIARHVERVVAGLDGRDGLHIEVAGPQDLPISLPRPVAPIDIPAGAITGHRRAVKTLRSLIRRDAYDVVHAHGLRAGIDAAIAARGTSASSFVTVHNVVLPEIFGRTKAVAYRGAEPLVVSLNTKVFAASRDIAERLAGPRHRNHHKIEVLHLGIEPPHAKRAAGEVRHELGIEPEEKLIVTVTRLAPQKAVDVLLRALAHLPNDVMMVVVGDGPLAGELRALANDLGISSRVRFVGFKSDPADYIAAGNVFSLSSVWEACALAAQEAMHLGVPVVSTDVGGMSELITDRVSGLLVPAGDPTSLAAALREVLFSAELARGLVEAASRDVRERFSTERMLQRLKDAYVAA